MRKGRRVRKEMLDLPEVKARKDRPVRKATWARKDQPDLRGRKALRVLPDLRGIRDRKGR